MILPDRYRNVPVVRAGVPRQSLRQRLSGGQVEWSTDLERILALPRRAKPDLEPIVRDLTARLKRPEGTQTLRAIQAWVLHEGSTLGGCIAQAAVGSGKTLMGMLMPMLMPNCDRAALLIPSDLRPQFARDWVTYGQHWKLPNLAGGDKFIVGRPVLHVIAYSEFSHKKGTDLLRRINPDLIMGDELQCVKNFESSRGSRFFNHFIDHDSCRLAGWTGSLTAESMADFAHFFAIALMNGSPVPLETRTVKEWARALDPDQVTCLEPGELLKFCDPGEDVRSGIRRRMIDTAGFVSSGVNEVTASLVFRKRTPPPMPLKVLEAYKTLKRRNEKLGGWVRPDGEVLDDQLEVVTCARQLGVGLYLRWIFPHGEPEALIDAWFEVRQAWNRELRAQLQASRQVFMDSPALCEEAAIRYYDGGCAGEPRLVGDPGESGPVRIEGSGCTRGPRQPHALGCKSAERLPLWNPQSYPAWREIEKLVYHETEVVWMDEWIARDAAAWAKEHVGIIWIEHPEFGVRLAELAGIPYYGEGEEAHRTILDEVGDRSIVCSIDAHHKGINLQCFNKMLIVQMPSSNTLVEQAVGRAHREGQKADSVQAWYYLHTVELENSLERARERAKFVREILGSDQKLAYCDWADE